MPTSPSFGLTLLCRQIRRFWVTTKPDPGDTVDSSHLRQSDSDLNETVRVDGLVVGMTFDDVVNKVPEPSSALFALLGLLGVSLIRRK